MFDRVDTVRAIANRYSLLTYMGLGAQRVWLDDVRNAFESYLKAGLLKPNVEPFRIANYRANPDALFNALINNPEPVGDDSSHPPLITKVCCYDVAIVALILAAHGRLYDKVTRVSPGLLLPKLDTGVVKPDQTAHSFAMVAKPWLTLRALGESEDIIEFITRYDDADMRRENPIYGAQVVERNKRFGLMGSSMVPWFGNPIWANDDTPWMRSAKLDFRMVAPVGWLFERTIDFYERSLYCRMVSPEPTDS